MANLSIRNNLDRVYNTETTIIIQSLRRDTTTYPNANEFSIQLPIVLNSIAEVVLTHYLSSQTAGVVQAIYIAIDQLQNNRLYFPGFPQPNITFIVDTGFNAVKIDDVMQTEINNTCTFPKDYKPNVNTLSFRMYDDTGALFTGLPDFTARLVVRHYC